MTQLRLQKTSLEMEKRPSFVINGRLRLPVGYRFCPTDEELIRYYLKRKTFSQPLPASVVPEFDVFQTEPWLLPGLEHDSRERRHFFSKRKSFACGNTSKRAAGSGYWKYIGKDKEIVVDKSNLVVGVRKTLVFCEGRRSRRTNTRWVMHEFCFVGTMKASYPFQIAVEGWAVYRIFQKRRNLKRKRLDEELPNGSKRQRLEKTDESNFRDFIVGYGIDIGSHAPNSPCLNEVSEICSEF